MTTRSVRIPDDIDERLVALAKSEHTSVNSILVQAAEELLARRAQEAAISAATEEVFARREGLFRRLADT
ncbi:Arc family DNA-binding protein [Actinomadura keratinilytica]|jgi:predicted transcriptional regulator|uniref:Arc-like DNA binding domain-containing protein n=1 Tax=Actinomadura keratinilytica TaxID=547461 RepID=A0ABP7YAV5_9ACTN